MHSKSSISMEMTVEEIRGIVRKHLAACEDDPKISLMKGGLFNTTYKITSESTRTAWVLRAGPVRRELLLPFEHRLMEAERLVYGFMEERGIPCPRVTAADFSKQEIDRDYTITEFIESVPLSDEAVPEAASDELYEQAGHWTARLHAVEGTRFGRMSELVQGGGDADWGRYLATHVEEIAERCIRYEVFEETTARRIARAFADHADLYRDVAVPRLVHADLWSGNVLRSPRETRDAQVRRTPRGVFFIFRMLCTTLTGLPKQIMVIVH
jgi:aminoglycoside phosphotransferase (APT) family kinase protein